MRGLLLSAFYLGIDVVKAKLDYPKLVTDFLRKALYMPAMVTLYKTDWGKPLFNRLAASGKPPKSTIGAKMCKFLHVAFGVLKSGKKFGPTLHSALHPRDGGGQTLGDSESVRG